MNKGFRRKPDLAWWALVLSLSLSGCGSGSTVTCVESTTGCDLTEMTLCINGSPMPIADCAADGWTCLDGACVTTAAETETEAAYRAGLNGLRLDNAAAEIVLDRYGGWVNAPEEFGPPEPGRFFQVKQVAGRWWFVTPDGNPFVSKGVTDVNYLGARLQNDEFHDLLVAKYGDEEGWAEASLARLQGWGFNTVGPWSGESMVRRLPHAEPILDSAGHAPRYTPDDVVTDYWSEGFAANAARVAAERAAPHTGDRFLIGYFLDNELFWGPDWRSRQTLLQAYAGFPADAPGRVEALRFVRERAGSLEAFNAVWGTDLASWDGLAGLGPNDFEPETAGAEEATEAFAVHAFDRYAGVAIAGLKAVDPDHLVLGCRFAWYPGDALIRAAASHFDVISLAGYHENWVDELDAVSASVDKPFFIEEFSFKAEDSGLPNVMNYAIVVETQKDRALAYHDYVKAFMRRPYAVGYHWYKWFDNPSDGFIAGDNFGLMNFADDPYLDLAAYAGQVNRAAEAWHLEGLIPAAPDR